MKMKSGAWGEIEDFKAGYVAKVFEQIYGLQLDLGSSWYNSKSSRPKVLLDSVCAHTGDGQPYLGQGSSLQQDRRIRLSVHMRLS